MRCADFTRGALSSPLIAPATAGFVSPGMPEPPHLHLPSLATLPDRFFRPAQDLYQNVSNPSSIWLFSQSQVRPGFVAADDAAHRREQTRAYRRERRE